MHTYEFKHGTKKWNVVFVAPGRAEALMRIFDTEAQAAAWASYMNGGNLPANASYGGHP